MSYYDNPQSQWSAPAAQNNWEHQGSTTPVRAGANGPQPQDDYAFSYQFDEWDFVGPNSRSPRRDLRAFVEAERAPRSIELMKTCKSPARATAWEADVSSPPLQVLALPECLPGLDGRAPHSSGPRSHSVNNFDDARGPQGQGGPNLQNFYATQRHQPSRGTNEAEQVMQAKRRMAAQRERELRNLHTEQQYQRKNSGPGRLDAVSGRRPYFSSRTASSYKQHASVLSEISLQRDKQMSEEETRDLISRQRSALYDEGQFSEKAGYVDETGVIRPGVPAPSGPSSIRGHSPLTFDSINRAPSSAEAGTPGSSNDAIAPPAEQTSRPQSTASPQTAGPTNRVFDNAVGPQSRTSTSSPTGASPPRDLAPGSKPGQSGMSVAPIGTRPSGTPSTTASSKRSTTPLASPGGWGRGNGVWGQSSGLGAPASVWG
ncbi:hypothetical protein G7046_g7650 [Stylonectria norvegica]|nr:hypothetical protein G7046_g7650 [Stylonectria norvegica]